MVAQYIIANNNLTWLFLSVRPLLKMCAQKTSLGKADIKEKHAILIEI